ncbi:MAG: 3-dehydroquinate synthase, partial [Inhella sp.]
RTERSIDRDIGKRRQARSLAAYTRRVTDSAVNALAVERFDPVPLPAFQPIANTTPLWIELGDARRYPIEFGPWSGASRRGGAAVIVTNERVGPLYAQRLRAAVVDRHRTVAVRVLPDGEAHKDWASVSAILDALVELGADRGSTVYALGGGVIGDLAGFAAASYMRGIDFVQVPTTLLAQVDSSVGGKTGFNHARGKNLIGAFHQPKAVWIDLQTLATLPDREYRAGLAEMVKYGPIADPAFFEWLEREVDALNARDPLVLSVAVRRSCQIKAAVVAADEHEGGIRAVLNLGHTFGHALEAGLGYGEILHGEAVAMGMVIAAQASMDALGCDSVVLRRLKGLLERLGLNTVAPALSPGRFIALMMGDKKNQGGAIRYVLLEGMGRPVLARLPHALALRAIAAHSVAP